MQQARAALLVLGGIGVLVSMACSAANEVPGYHPSDDENGGASITGAAGKQDASTLSCADPGAGDLAGCACAQATRACFTVKAGLHNTGGCTDGTQKCVKQGEFSTWGACTGEVKACSASGGSGDEDGGSSSEPSPSPTPEPQCVPGAVRWCDSPQGCAWGKQPCKPDGTWGTCSETAARPGTCGFFMGFPIPTYDQDCCVAQGGCCEDYDGPDPTMSKGNCAGIASPGHIIR